MLQSMGSKTVGHDWDRTTSSHHMIIVAILPCHIKILETRMKDHFRDCTCLFCKTIIRKSAHNWEN